MRVSGEVQPDLQIATSPAVRPISLIHLLSATERTLHLERRLAVSANRATTARTIQRQFNHLLAITGLKHDGTTNAERSIYSLRHTAICMRLVLSHGQVNIYSLAKNAGTSVNQIERFYVKRLPISKELMESLQSFGG